MAVGVSVFILPEELTPTWDKQPLCDQMAKSVSSLLDSGNEWQCEPHFQLSPCPNIDDTLVIVPRVSAGTATLSVKCITSNVLVSPMLYVVEFANG